MMNRSLHKRTVLLLSFLLPAAVTAAVFALCGLAPFGSRTLGVMDMSHQYLSFLYSLRDILSGRAGLRYLPSMCLGGGMPGLFAYYLTSPLNLLTCLFPRKDMYLAVSLLYFLRVGLCGLTMCIYAGRRHGYGLRCLAAALAYAMMGYMTAYSFNYLWQDSVILLPLTALGIARLTESGRPFLYILSLAGALYLNFYIGYILCLFSVLFFLYELLSGPRTERRDAGKTLLTFALSSLAAGALAAVVLLPAFLSLRSGKAEFSLSVLTLTPSFRLLRLFSKLYPGAFGYDEIMPAGLPQIFCGTVTVSLTILYFADRRIPLRRRLLTGGLMLTLCLSFWIRGLDLIWHCLNTPNWYNFRYSFLLTFLMAAAADRTLAADAGEKRRPRIMLLPPLLIAVVSVPVFALESYAFADWKNALIAVLIAAIACRLLYTAGDPARRGRGAALLMTVLLLIHAGELASSSFITLRELTAQSVEDPAYRSYVIAKAQALALADTGGELVRTESPVSFSMNRCEPMLFGYDGLSHYGSTMDPDNLELLDRLGFDRYEDVWATYGAGVTAAADTLLGVRRIVSDTLTKNYTPVADAAGYTVYENEAALPAAWTAEGAFAADISADDSFAYMNALYAAAAPETGGEIFTPAAVTDTALENFTAEGTVYRRTQAAPASVTYTLSVAADGALYGELDIPDYPGVMIFADGTMRAWYATAQTNGTVYLGDYRAGDTVTVTVQASSDISVTHAAFATENAGVLARYAQALSEGGCPLTRLSSSHFRGGFTTGSGDALLVFTLPHDPCWTVLLDGVPAELIEVQGCLMAVTVGPGSHQVELEYHPAGLVPGAAVSAAAAIACAAWFLLRRKRWRA